MIRACRSVGILNWHLLDLVPQLRCARHGKPAVTAARNEAQIGLLGASVEAIHQDTVNPRTLCKRRKGLRHPEIQNQNRKAKQTISLSCTSGIIRFRDASNAASRTEYARRFEGWATRQAQLEKYYEAFLLIAANQGIDPDQTVAVDFQYYAMTYDVSIDMSDTLSDESIDPQEADADATMQDPLTFLHDGADSYYYGSLWTDSGHLVDSNEDQTMNAHIDPFGPLNPLHYLLQIPSMLLGSGPSFSGTCSVNAGCVVNP